MTARLTALRVEWMKHYAVFGLRAERTTSRAPLPDDVKASAWIVHRLL
jgi:hypothetical protein